MKALRRRQLFPAHPSRKMLTGETQTFRRKLVPECRLRGKYFRVLKITQRSEDRPLQDIFTFYAIYGRYNIFSLIENPTNADIKYEYQIGFIRCNPGWINHLQVFEDASWRRWDNEQRQYVLEVVDTRRCGVGVVLTELCLLDPEVFVKDHENKADINLNNAGTTLHDNCDKLVGLLLTTTEAHVYLSSAIRMGYQRLLIDMSDGMSHTFNAYDTSVAQQNYNDATGSIQACDENERCEACFRQWYFCDDNGGQG